MRDWQYPETWQVGDSLDAETLNRRIRDQHDILLRRPLTVVHSTADQSLPDSTDVMLSFNTIDQDDDGMCVTATPVSEFYVQRDGTYQIWHSTMALGNGIAGTCWDSAIWVSGTTSARRWDLESTFTNVSNKEFCHAITGTIYMVAGEYIYVTAWQNTGGTVTLQAALNTPRIAIMWLGIS